MSKEFGKIYLSSRPDMSPRPLAHRILAPLNVGCYCCTDFIHGHVLLIQVKA